MGAAAASRSGSELTDFEGVLAGVAAYRGSLPLLGRPRRSGAT